MNLVCYNNDLNYTDISLATRLNQSESVLQIEEDGCRSRWYKITEIEMPSVISVTTFYNLLNWNVLKRFLTKISKWKYQKSQKFHFLSFSSKVTFWKSRVFDTLRIFLKKFWNWQQLILVRGSTTDYENFLRALRKRNGGWQGYLAEIMDVTQVRPPPTRWRTQNESYLMSHRSMSYVTGPKKPLDVNLIKKVFWLIKFVADYFFVKGMATSNFQYITSGFDLKLPVSKNNFRSKALKDPTAIVNVFRNLKLEPDEIRKIINQNCQAWFSNSPPKCHDLIGCWVKRHFENHSKPGNKRFMRLFLILNPGNMAHFIDIQVIVWNKMNFLWISAGIFEILIQRNISLK